MSENWSYFASVDDESSLIKSIYCDRSKFPPHLRIYPWVVVLKSGERIGLYTAESKDYVYSSVDKAALENAMMNATALRLGAGLRDVEMVDGSTMCCRWRIS